MKVETHYFNNIVIYICSSPVRDTDIAFLLMKNIHAVYEDRQACVETLRGKARINYNLPEHGKL